MKKSTIYKSLAIFNAFTGLTYSILASLVMRRLVKNGFFDQPENSKMPKLLWKLGRNVIGNTPSIAVSLYTAKQVESNLRLAEKAKEDEARAEESRKALSEAIDHLYHSSIKNDIDNEEDEEADPADITFDGPHKLDDELAASISAAPEISMEELEKDEALHEDEEVNLFD